MKIALLSILVVASVAVYAQEASGTSWLPDNRVNSLTYGDGKIFIAGDFGWFGARAESEAFVFTPALAEVAGYPVVQGPVQHAVADGSGGWYASAYGIITHIKSDKTSEVLPFTFEGGGYPIRQMEKIGNTLYVIGQFTTVNSIARGYGAAIDLTNNTLLGWNPASNGYIYCIKGSAGVVYMGGSFTSIGGQSRSKIGAVDATSALATAWNPNVAAGAGYVYTIEADASAVYFGGSFSNVGGGSPARTNFAAVNKTTGALAAFNPRPNDDVVALALDGNTLYLAGDFTTIAGVTKPQLAAVDITTGTASSFAVTFPSYYNKDVYALAVDGARLFVGGNFANINNTQVANLAVLNKVSGVSEPTEDRAIGGSVLTIVPSGGNILVGGSILGITGVSNSYGCVALDGVTGTGTSWRPEFPDIGNDAFLSSLRVHYQNNTVYYISQVYVVSDGASGTIVGALSSGDGSALPGWPVNVNGDAYWAFSDDALYLAGNFSMVNGVARDGFAALDLTTGEVLPWTIDMQLFFGDGDDLYSIAVADNAFYISGDFSRNLDGEQRTNFAAWNATTGELLAWNPPLDFATIGTAAGGKVYMTSPDALRVDGITGDTDDWTPDFDPGGGIENMVIKGNEVYYAGYFSPGIVRVDINTGELTAIQPQLDDPFFSEGSVRALAVSSNKLYAGGSFSYQAGAESRSNYAEYPLVTTNSAPEISNVFRTVPVQSIVSIFLPDIVSDIDDNADLTTAEIIGQPQSGAAAYIDGDYLVIDYTGLAFAGSDILTLRVCDTEGACTEQQITLELDGTVRVYNAISPNSDGKNEILRIANIELFAKNHVSVFNRWGDLVFEADNYNNDDRVFNGLNKNGKELPSGIYYYKIELSGGKTQTGYLSLKR